MVRSSPSVLEEIAVGLYFLVLCGGIAGFGWVQMTPGPAIGGAFLIIGLTWLTIIIAVSASLVVLAINAYKYLRDEPPVWKAATFALLTPLATGVTIYLVFATTNYQLWFLVGGLGFLCSLGLVITVFEGRARRILYSDERLPE